MDPIILAGIIGALATLGAAIFRRRTKESDEKLPPEEVDAALKAHDHGEKLRRGITRTTFSVLEKLESGRNCVLSELREQIYPGFAPADPELFDDQFGYRLVYLRALGLVDRIGAREFAITPAGASFIRLARAHGFYG